MARTRRPTQRQPSPVVLVWGGLAVLLLLTVLVAVLVPAGSGATAGPTIGDHWHAAYRIVLCGEEQPPLPVSPGNVHTHGDGLIHVHPQTAAETGANANLERFFAASGVVIGKDYIQLPGGRLYRNGDPCTDGQPGTLRVTVNGNEVADFLRYVPRDGDTIQIEFG